MILQAKNISKRYGNHLAVNNIHLLQFEKERLMRLYCNGWEINNDFCMLIGLK